MKYTVVYGKGASKELRRLDKGVQSKICGATETLAANPRPRGCRKMVGYLHRWRIRIGDFRIVYDIHDEVVTVHVIKIGHRRDVYR